MARPRIYTEERVVTAVRLPRSVHTRLQKQSKIESVPVNTLIASAVETYLEKRQSHRFEGKRS